MIASSTSENGVWLTEEGITIGYSLVVLDEIRRLSVDGLNLFAHGGLEVGGVLYGLRDGNRISVTSFAEAPCEHALGPGFVLSERDREKFAALLEAPSGSEPVGWYRTHTRSGLDLDRHDCTLFEQFFGGARSIGLTVKPTLRGPADAAFFVREPGGEVRPTAAREFLLNPLGLAKDQPESDSLPPVAIVPLIPKPEFKPEVSTAEIQASKDAVHGRSRAKRKLFLWVASAVVALCCVLAVSVYWPRPPLRLGLNVRAVMPGQLRIEWDRSSPTIQEGESALLRIVDGNVAETTLLDGNQLRTSGSLMYTQHTDHISVRFRVNAPRGVRAEEVIDFIGPLAPAPPEAAPPPEPAVAPETATSSPAPQSALVRNERERDQRPLPPTDVVQLPRRTLRLPPAQTAAPPAISQVNVPAAPQVAAPSAEPALPSAFSGLLHPKPAAPEPAAPVYLGPRSGRIIWTGILGRRGIVEIDGARVNLGSATGALPGVPISLRVSPAEFSRDGLILYTADGAAHGHVEKPSKENGWNSVRFEYDPVRVRDLVILESPNRSNDFKRLVVRSDGRSCPAIVIDWSVRP